MASVLESAIAYATAGLSMLPILTDGSKGPAAECLDGRQWKRYQDTPPSETELRHWFGNGTPRGVGIIGGKVSGNLCILDFDSKLGQPSVWSEYVKACKDHGMFPDLKQCAVVATPGGGFHVYVRTIDAAVSTMKLARQMTPLDNILGEHAVIERVGKRYLVYGGDQYPIAPNTHGVDCAVWCCCETKAAGGYVIAPPSPGACHPTGNEYKLRGTIDLCHIPTLPDDAVAGLLAMCRLFDEYVEPEEIEHVPKSFAPTTGSNRPGDDYNARGDLGPLLERAGWHRGRYMQGKQLWRRPGKDRGVSATENYADRGLFYAFTPNAAPFAERKGYSKFHAYTLLEHNGDFKAAAKQLGYEGYGDPPTMAQNGATVAAETPIASHAANTVPDKSSTDIEIAIVSAMASDPASIPTVLGKVSQNDLASPAARALFRAIANLDSARLPVDAVLLQTELVKQGDYPAVVSAELIAQLFADPFASTNVEHYLGIVSGHARRREITQILATNYNKLQANEPITQVQESLIAALSDIGRDANDHGLVHLNGPLEEMRIIATEARKTPGAIRGQKIGLRKFDRLSQGLQPANLIILAARPSMGKTAMMLTMAYHVAYTERKFAAVFSLEMSALELSRRLACSHCQIDSHKLMNGTVNDLEWDRIDEFVYNMSNKRLYIDDATDMTTEHIRAELRRKSITYGNPAIVCVDYLQLLQSARRTDNRAQELGYIARGLKAISREFKCPVVALSQLSREVEKRPNRRPILSDLRDSGSIEAEADMVCFLYREAYYKMREAFEANGIVASSEKLTEPEDAEAIVAKYRNGPTGFVKIDFIPKYSMFSDGWDGTGPTPI